MPAISFSCHFPTVPSPAHPCPQRCADHPASPLTLALCATQRGNTQSVTAYALEKDKIIPKAPKHKFNFCGAGGGTPLGTLLIGPEGTQAAMSAAPAARPGWNKPLCFRTSLAACTMTPRRCAKRCDGERRTQPIFSLTQRGCFPKGMWMCAVTRGFSPKLSLKTSLHFLVI